MTKDSRMPRTNPRVAGGMSVRAIACAAAVVLAASWPLVAHHSFSAEFDSSQELKSTGTVTKIEWQNPHAWFYLDVEELCLRSAAAEGADEENPWTCAAPDAGAADWAFELASPNGLMRLGWSRNSLKIGEQVTVEGTRARDGTRKSNARTIMTPDGRRLLAGSSEGSNP